MFFWKVLVKWCAKKGALLFTKAFLGTPGPHSTLLSRLSAWCFFIEPSLELTASKHCQEHFLRFFLKVVVKWCVKKVALFIT